MCLMVVDASAEGSTTTVTVPKICSSLPNDAGEPALGIDRSLFGTTKQSPTSYRREPVHPPSGFWFRRRLCNGRCKCVYVFCQ